MDIIDFHSHILPGLDHGSHSTATSLKQLALAKNSGVTRIVATSHFYPQKENVDRFISRRKTSYDKLISAADNNAPQIKLGAEVLICDNIEKMPMLEDLCIEGTKTLLIELPFTDISKSHLDSVKNLIRMGFNIVLAHADRYSPDEIEAFITVGAKIQLNADSLDKLLVKKHLIGWIDRGVVVAIGSDIHSDDQTAYKHFVKAIKKIGTRAEKIAEKSNSIWN